MEKLIASDTVEQMMESLAQGTHAEVHGDADEGDCEASVGDGGCNSAEDSGRQGASPSKRHRGDELKRQRETTKIHTILTSMHSLPFDPEGEREREEIADSLAAADAPRLLSHKPASCPSPSLFPRPLVPSHVSESPSDFVPSTCFLGGRPGYVFKLGLAGLGYYKDLMVTDPTPTGLLGEGASKRVRFAD